MDTKKLRQKILDLAIHGKLVPQDLNDEPASVLLERIKAEKEQLIKEGKIKRQKKSASSDTSHYGNDVPFEVPEGWVWCRLKDITSFLSRGKSPQYSDERKYPVFAQKCNLKDGGISLVQARFLDPKTINKWGSEYKLCTGDVLINSTGTGTVGRTRIFNSNCLGTYPFVVPDSHVSVVRTFKEVNSYYIYMLISSRVIQEYLEDNLAGSTNQKELYIGVLEDLFVPLPPMDEQDRIVMKSNKLFSIIDCIEKEEENLSVAVQKAKSKILDLALSGHLTSDTSHYPQLPDGWKNKNFAQLFEVLASKSYQIQQKEIHLSGKYPVISQSASYIEGYSDREEKLYNAETPVIIFGDHTRNVKYVNFDFIVGADGVKILKPMINSKFAYYLTLYNSKQIGNRGYSRHFQYLKKQSWRIPSEKEQQRIVEIIEHCFLLFDIIIT